MVFYWEETKMFALFSENGICGDEIIFRVGSANKIATDLLKKNDLMFVAECYKSKGTVNDKKNVKKILDLILKSKADAVIKSDIENFNFEISGGIFKCIKCAETEKEIFDFADLLIEQKKDKKNHILISNEKIKELSKKIKASIQDKNIYNILCFEASKEQYL